MRRIYWRCYPPYIDAYNTSPYDEAEEYDKKTTRAKAIEDLKNAMKSNAHSWGVQSIGEQTLKNGEPETINGKLVLTVGSIYFTGKTGKESVIKLALVVDRNKVGYWWDTAEFVEFDYPSEWNVT